jgi:hypothetical protein
MDEWAADGNTGPIARCGDTRARAILTELGHRKGGRRMRDMTSIDLISVDARWKPC